jgi:hypothetical protein
MKLHNSFLIIICLLFYNCKKVEVVCDSVIIENPRTNWKYCPGLDAIRSPTLCDSIEHILYRKYTNAKGKIFKQRPQDSGFAVLIDTSTVVFPINLPDCYQKEGLLIIYSGEVRRGNSYTGPITPFEVALLGLTKIEVAQ